MNSTVPWLSRQIVYSFLLGLILGAVIIGLVDAYAKQPLFSAASGVVGGGLPTAPSGTAAPAPNPAAPSAERELIQEDEYNPRIICPNGKPGVYPCDGQMNE